MSKTEQENPFGFDPEIDIDRLYRQNLTARQEHNQWKNPNLVSRKWGTYEVLTRKRDWVIKILTILPQKSISLQKHQHRAERWLILEGEGTYASNYGGATKITGRKRVKGATMFIPPNTWHWIKNTSDNKSLVILETWFGEKLEESDIERKEDESEIIIPE